MKRHGYANYHAIEEELRSMQPQAKVLGSLGDGIYECEVIDSNPHELLLKHGSYLHAQKSSNQLHKLLQWGTGFQRPAGGMVIVQLTKGKIDEVMRSDYHHKK